MANNQAQLAVAKRQIASMRELRQLASKQRKALAGTLTTQLEHLTAEMDQALAGLPPDKTVFATDPDLNEVVIKEVLITRQALSAMSDLLNRLIEISAGELRAITQAAAPTAYTAAGRSTERATVTATFQTPA